MKTSILLSLIFSGTVQAGCFNIPAVNHQSKLISVVNVCKMQYVIGDKAKYSIQLNTPPELKVNVIILDQYAVLGDYDNKWEYVSDFSIHNFPGDITTKSVLRIY